MSADVKLIPRPPALVVRRNMNLSLSGLLYSSIATIRSSWAVLPSIRQYSAQCDGQRPRRTREQVKLLTILTEETVVFEDIQDTRHLAEYKDTRALYLHIFQEFVEDDHLAGVVDYVFVSGVWWPRFLQRSIQIDQRRRTSFSTHRSIEKIGMTCNFPKLDKNERIR
jgi:hypothetical protein